MPVFLYLTLFLVFTIVLFFGLVLLWLATAWWDKKRRLIQIYSRFWSRGIYILCPKWNVEIRGLHNIHPKQPYLVLSNHQAMLDIPLLLHLPINFRFVSKQEVYKIPFFGATLYMRDDVAIQRGGAASAKKMIKDCQKYLAMGVSVAIFPEGTRTKTGEIGAFHSGAFLVAKRANVPILPVVINGNYDAFKGGKCTQKTFVIEVMKPIETAEIEDLTMEELKDRMEELIKEKFKSIR